MYKLLLAWRYLCTKYIALASIVSVTLGVATLVVVNSVMEGFSVEMHKRLHGILSDIVLEGPGLDGFPDPVGHMRQVREVLGDDVQGMTATVAVPAMLNFQVGGQWVTRQVNLVGIDQESYAAVGDFSQYLLHPENRERIEFLLRETGYPERLPPSGWEYRRDRVAWEQAYRVQRAAWEQEVERQRDRVSPPELGRDPHPLEENRPVRRAFRPPFNDTADGEREGEREPELPSIPRHLSAPFPGGERSDDGSPDERNSAPGVGERYSAREFLEEEPFSRPPQQPGFELPNRVEVDRRGGSAAGPRDPFAGSEGRQAGLFDPARQQHSGIILGIALASLRHRDPDGEVREHFLCRPGDDVKLTFPTVGMPPAAVSDTFTVVDFYECKMSEYDASFAFVPLHVLQELRGMIDPASGARGVTAIQIKLRPEANLNECRDKLSAHFAQGIAPYRVQTWKDLQGPLLAAVQMETTILNILLFMIIAVAGFGILATFSMIVVEKTRDIGILKSLGAPSHGVMSIFLSYGVSLGVVGAGAGTVLGLLFVTYINEIAAVLETVTGREVFDQTVYYFQEIPAIIEPLTVTWVTLGAIAIAVLAAVLPALRAARMHPVEALRYE